MTMVRSAKGRGAREEKGNIALLHLIDKKEKQNPFDVLLWSTTTAISAITPTTPLGRGIRLICSSTIYAAANHHLSFSFVSFSFVLFCLTVA